MARISEPQRRWLNYAAMILAIIWLGIISLTLDPDIDDFKQYWQAAVNLLQNGDPYVYASDIPPTLRGYYYLPTFIYLIQPVGLIEQVSGRMLWFWLNCAALAGYIALCIYISCSMLARRYWGPVVLAMCMAPPTRLNLQLGQISIMLGLMLVVSLSLAQRRPAISGLLLALSSLFRIFPALLGIFFLIQRLRKMIVWTIIWGLLLIGIPVLLYGAGAYQNFWQHVMHSPDYPFAAGHNISFTGFFRRMFEISPYGIPVAHMPVVAKGLVVCASLIVLGVCLWVTHPTENTLDLQMQFSLWLCAMMLLSTTNGYYTLVLLLLPLLSTIRYLECYPDRYIRNWLLVATALCFVPPDWSNHLPGIYNQVHIGWGLLLLTPSLYGLLLYTGLLAWVVQRRKNSTRSTATDQTISDTTISST